MNHCTIKRANQICFYGCNEGVTSISEKIVATYLVQKQTELAIDTNLSILLRLNCLSHDSCLTLSIYIILSSELNHPINELLGVIEHVATY